MENNTSTNNENGNDANCFFEPVFDSFPLCAVKFRIVWLIMTTEQQ